MKTIKCLISCFLMVLCIQSTLAQQATSKNQDEMKTYLIEREIPKAGQLSGIELQGISKKSCDVLDDLGSANIQWLHSYVTEDKIYCVYKAKNKELIKEHAAKGGFPVNKISELSTTIGPETAKQGH